MTQPKAERPITGHRVETVAETAQEALERVVGIGAPMLAGTLQRGQVAAVYVTSLDRPRSGAAWHALLTWPVGASIGAPMAHWEPEPKANGGQHGDDEGND